MSSRPQTHHQQDDEHGRGDETGPHRPGVGIRFRLAFEHAPIGMAIVALDGSFRRVNHALCEITGYEERSLLGGMMHDITHPDDLELDADENRELLAGTIRAYRRRSAM